MSPVRILLIILLYISTGSSVAFADSELNLRSGQEISETFNMGASAAGQRWSYWQGGVPQGITWSISGSNLVLSGSSQAIGTSRIWFVLSDSQGSVFNRYSLTINVSAPTITINPAELPGGKVGQAYAMTLTASGGAAPYSFAVTGGALPAGLSLTANGTLSGTPTSADTASFTVTATDAEGNQGTKTYPLSIAAAPTIDISPTTMPSGTLGSYYSVWFYPSGGKAPYALSHSSGALVPGLSVISGRISGTPSSSGTFTFTLTATDTDGYQGARSYTVTIAAAPTISIYPVALPSGKVGLAYNATLSAAGGRAPYAFKTGAGTVPPGLSLTQDGKLEGIPTQAGTYSFWLGAEDADGHGGVVGEANGWREYTVTIAAAPTITINPATLPSGKVGQAYGATLSASGGTGPYRFSIDGQPYWLNLDQNGTFSGTAEMAGSFSFTVTATDTEGYEATKSYTLTIAPDIQVGPANLPSGKVGLTYTGQTLTASGGTGDFPFGFNVSAGALPPGLGLANDGRISGTPTFAGSFSFDVTATELGGTWANGTRNYTLVIAEAPVIAISPENLPDGRVGAAYDTDLTASGGTGPYNFTVTTGALPAGLTLSNSGKLSGTPAEDDTSTFTVTATDADGYSGTRQYTISVNPPHIAITPQTLANGKVGKVYETLAFEASGGTGPYSFAVVTGALPAGLTLGANGELSGTPGQAGSFTFTVRATDANSYHGSHGYTLVIAEAPVIAISPAELPGGKVGQAYAEQTLTASGGTGPYTFEVTGLPSGLGFAGSKISGTPTAAGSFQVTVTATDAEGYTGTHQYTLVIAAAPVIAISPAELPGGKVGQAYAEQTLTASGGTGPYTFEVTGLPSGLSLAGNKISGTPTQAGTSTVSVTATDAEGYTGTHQYTLVVAAAPVAQNHSLVVVAGTVGRVNLIEGATGGPFIGAAIVAGAASEAGKSRIEQGDRDIMLIFDAANDFAGTTQLRYKLSNSAGDSAPATVTINVIARPDPSKDPEVIGLVQAQTDTAKQFARTQITNINQRLEQLHGDSECRNNSLELDLGLEDAQLRGSLAPLEKAMRDQQAVPACRNFAFWSNGQISWGEQSDDLTELNHTRVGISGGIDYRFTPKFIGGIAFGYGRDVTDVGQNGTQSRARSFAMSAYGSYRPGPGFYLDGVFGYGSMNFESQRYVTATGDMARGERDGHQIFGAVTAGYEYRDSGWLLSPYGRIEASHSKLKSFSETGGGIYNLTYGDQSIDSLSAVIGARVEYTFPMHWGLLKPQARLEFAHDFEGASRATLGYRDIGDLPYGIDVEPFSRDRLQLELGIEAQLNNGWNLGANYKPALGTNGNERNHVFGVQLSTQF